MINIRSRDDQCFAWSVVASLYPTVRRPSKMTSYPHYSTVLRFDDCELPMSLHRITKFERLNELSVNVYAIRDKEKKDKNGRSLLIVPLRLTKDKKEKHVNLLYVPDMVLGNGGHFVCIKNLSRLVNYQLTRAKRKVFICDR